MNRQEIIFNEIQDIFRKELGDDKLIISLESTPNTVEKWDSVSNLIIISALEEKFNIVFPVEFIFSAENVGDLAKYIQKSEVK